MPQCEICDEELEESWIQCPYCIGTDDNQVSLFQGIINCTVGMIAIYLGFFFDQIIVMAAGDFYINNEAIVTIREHSAKIEMVFLLVGLYLIIATLNNRNTN